MEQEHIMAAEEGKYHISAGAANYDERVKVLNHYDTFAIFDRSGNIHPHSRKAQGIFYQGTRFINRLELTVNEKKPLLLSSSIKEENDILSADLTNPDLMACNIGENALHISRSQLVRNGVYHEELVLANYGEKACSFDLALSFGADFRDIFEIRGMLRSVQPNKPTIHTEKNKIVFDYLGLDNIYRRTEIVFPSNNLFKIDRHQAQIKIQLQPHQKYSIEYTIFLKSEEGSFGKESHVGASSFEQAKKAAQENLQQVKALFAGIETSNEQFNHWLFRSQSDLLSLLAQTQYGKYPYAGVPWYNTIFGRDGIITAMEVLSIAPFIAKDVLQVLANKQATELIPEKDAEPGKILHEARTGEMAKTGEIPFKEYYGTIDATPLFLMLAGMYFRQTADIETIKAIWPNIKAAINWINDYGDLDGDGFVEYKHKAENGLTNQGWKDSYDSIMYANGELCEPPIALCEVQGYTYAAKRHIAVLARILNEDEFAQQLTDQADTLKKKFNEQFWSDELGCFVLALDGNKNQCKVLASNAGHCLFTGIADADKAKKVAAALTGSNMFSGWGIRTLGAGEVRYNPMSYHNGSIWPHDNAIIAYGLSLYGFQKEALQIMQALFDASLYVDLQRLPELYCGFDRRSGEGPTAYPVACSPQAWSVSAVFMLLQACIRMDINALNKQIIFNKPELPTFLKKITITGIKLGDGVCHFEMFRHQHDVGFNVLQKPDDWELIIKK